MNKVRCTICGDQNVDVVFNETTTWGSVFREGDIEPTQILSLDENGGYEEGCFCNTCGDYVDCEYLEAGDEIPSLGDEEEVVELKDGFSFIGAESSEGGYVRIVDKDNREIVFWDKQEWIDDPESVLFAIIGAILNPSKIEELIK